MSRCLPIHTLDHLTLESTRARVTESGFWVLPVIAFSVGLALLQSLTVL